MKKEEVKEYGLKHWKPLLIGFVIALFIKPLMILGLIGGLGYLLYKRRFAKKEEINEVPQ